MSEVGHAHFVQIREGKGAVQANGRGLLVDGTFLGTDIVTGPGQQGEEFFHKEGFRQAAGLRERFAPTVPEQAGAGWGRFRPKRGQSYLMSGDLPAGTGEAARGQGQVGAGFQILVSKIVGKLLGIRT